MGINWSPDYKSSPTPSGFQRLTTKGTDSITVDSHDGLIFVHVPWSDDGREWVDFKYTPENARILAARILEAADACDPAGVKK